MLIGPDGHDLNDKPLVGEGRKVAFEMWEDTGTARSAPARSEKRFPPDVSGKPDDCVRRNRPIHLGPTVLAAVSLVDFAKSALRYTSASRRWTHIAK